MSKKNATVTNGGFDAVNYDRWWRESLKKESHARMFHPANRKTGTAANAAGALPPVDAPHGTYRYETAYDKTHNASKGPHPPVPARPHYQSGDLVTRTIGLKRTIPLAPQLGYVESPPTFSLRPDELGLGTYRPVTSYDPPPIACVDPPPPMVAAVPTVVAPPLTARPTASAHYSQGGRPGRSYYAHMPSTAPMSRHADHRSVPMPTNTWLPWNAKSGLVSYKSRMPTGVSRHRTGGGSGMMSGYAAAFNYTGGLEAGFTQCGCGYPRPVPGTVAEGGVLDDF
uniref:Uncharacterized protein n=1 Tax=Chromera velia CCMP2878 TaxID=1169474 RepID=A0A0G4H557_9ALVE|eukprot:Cvel_24727.t1-p1 / transcript=Cvel_24727.t1 / gene=Cvel_24727 / organism=Chromera_velia_CCMP2878 / gene_product=hypothetical protein / transcript_product=hypothetical protein / location=Cvel_scaffold2714:473-2366(+) / protein_length=282 / sequence_SO=supercontig / SO=protein_coding / is_pseudo=false